MHAHDELDKIRQVLPDPRIEACKMPRKIASRARRTASQPKAPPECRTPIGLCSRGSARPKLGTRADARTLNMFSLIAVGTGVAWVYSVVATLAPGLFPAAFRGHDGTVAVYFEAAAGITVLVLLGQVLELRARERTSGAIRALLDLAPKTARRIANTGSETEIPLDHVIVGDRLHVRPGEKVPVDGSVLDGRSSVDESMVTGESMPVTKAAGAKVIAGTLNQSGSFVMRAEKVGRDTLLAQIVQMVAAAQVPGADPEAGRSGLVVVRSFGHCCSTAHLRRVVRIRTEAPLRVRACCRSERAHHRLPVRAWIGYADVDHGRRGTRRASWRLDQECRGSGAVGEGRHPGD